MWDSIKGVSLIYIVARDTYSGSASNTQSDEHYTEIQRQEENELDSNSGSFNSAQRSKVSRSAASKTKKRETTTKLEE